MVRTKITYYKMMTPKRRAEMRAVQARRAACIAAGLPPNSSEEEEREQEWVPEEMEEGEASNEKMEEVEAPEEEGEAEVTSMADLAWMTRWRSLSSPKRRRR